MERFRQIIRSYWILSVAFAALVGLLFSYISEFVLIEALPIAEQLRQIFLVSNQSAGLLTELALNALVYATVSGVICILLMPLLDWGLVVRSYFYPVVMIVAIVINSLWPFMVIFTTGIKKEQLAIMLHIAISLFAIMLVILGWSFFYIKKNAPNN